ncbi:hypothetical protein SCHIN_v1c07770 [Spiroplasma chinense]|uniref:HTH rpiR-type domain-containing protein n=1 Tax=Spiroplasma chinense TaxID=216932 RepID=A0A5B9Y790_9MOLU|nr:MurR/RpiR family transcriptional regulator [Spiroplasma chinense]QEH61972.1 hypothetical protein SCHIN_v1c07770 [Spiroplasma chinense]
MKSIREVLSNLASQNSETTSKIIASVILKDYDHGIFKTQTELSKECFVSESVITKFAKQLGYSGWKEFYYSLKNEYKKYYIQPSSESVETNMLFEQIKIFNNYINVETQFLTNLAKAINEKKKVIILPSYQLEDCCEFFYECLIELGMEVYYVKNKSLFHIIFSKNLEEFVVLVAMSGQDNSFLVENYNSLNKEVLKKNGFIISSRSQEHKISDFADKLILKSYSIYSSFKIRRIFLEYLFVSVTYKIKTF